MATSFVAGSSSEGRGRGGGPGSTMSGWGGASCLRECGAFFSAFLITSFFAVFFLSALFFVAFFFAAFSRGGDFFARLFFLAGFREAAFFGMRNLLHWL